MGRDCACCLHCYLARPKRERERETHPSVHTAHSIDDYAGDLEQETGAVSTARPAGCRVTEELEDRFQVSWLEAYGTTETGADISVAWADHARTIGTATIGKPLPGGDARIVDDTMTPVRPGEIGELHVRGPAMMSGYWRDPEATRAAFQDGWYRTGYLAQQEESGFLYLVGRRKDMIRRAGENIAAAEVEAVLQQHPAFLLAACVAVPDAIRNEEIKVFVQCAELVSVADLIDFLESRLARFKIPRF